MGEEGGDSRFEQLGCTLALLLANLFIHAGSHYDHITIK
jgi:hypothetical protein